MGRIVLLGATGYTGRLTAESMVRAGLAPVLAGRDPERLAALAERLSAVAPDAAAPSWAVADVTHPASVRDLLHSGDDVLVSTAGPFTRLGEPAVVAAIEAGAGYVDSTGEPPFIRRVFQEWGPQAQRTGARLLTAFGYDFVPGNLAAAAALRDARADGRPASRVDVGYFLLGSVGTSAGTRASVAEMTTAMSMRFAGGRLQAEVTGAHVRSFDLGDGRRWEGMSIGGSEHLTLPRIEPALDEVGVYLGWAGRWTKPFAAATAATGLLARVPVLRAGLAAATRQFMGASDGSGPEGGGKGRSVALAVAYDGVGRQVGRARVDGPAPYPMTGDLLAWAAAMMATGRATGPGALGPVDAFGWDALVTGCADTGLRRTV